MVGGFGDPYRTESTDFAQRELFEQEQLAVGDRRAQLRPPIVSQLDLFPLTAQEWKDAIEQLRLTRQQARIVEQILRGLRDKQVAAALNVSEATVRTHLARLFTKLAIDDRVQLVLCVLACRRSSRDGQTS
jgi:DNA-binding NarL/FixJ family response regulator